VRSLSEWLRRLFRFSLPTLACASGFAVACATLRDATPAEREQGIRDGFHVLDTLCRAYDGTGGKHNDEVEAMCLAIELGNRVKIELEPEPDAGQ